MHKITIKCPICKAENGVQNICCVSCGTKLEKNVRETIIKKEKKKKIIRQKAPKAASPPKLKQNRNEIYRFLFNVLFAGCAFALIGLVFSKPKLPPQSDQTEPLAHFRNKAAQIQGKQISHTVFTEEETGAYLKENFKITTITGENEKTYIYFPHRIIVNFKDSNYSLLLSGKILNLELFFKLKGYLQQDGQTLSIKITQLYLGNLPIPSFFLNTVLDRIHQKLNYYLEPPIAYIAIKNSTLVVSTTHRATSMRKKTATEPEEKIVYEWELDEEAPFEENITQNQTQPNEISSNIKETQVQYEEETEEDAVPPVNPSLYFKPKEKPKKEKPITYNDKSYKLGMFFYQKKNYTSALKHFQAFLKKYPNHPKALEVKDLIDDINIKINS